MSSHREPTSRPTMSSTSQRSKRSSCSEWFSPCVGALTFAHGARCSPTLRQVGFRNRVWLLRRSVVNDRIKVSLGSYDLPFWPEALLVVRT